MTATPLHQPAPARPVERGSGPTAWHCGFCGTRKVVPSLAYLCELRHLADDTAAAAA